MERPCSSIRFSSQPSLGYGGACNHPIPHTCLGVLAKHSIATCPTCLALGVSQPPTGSTFPCQAAVGCSLVPVPAAHQEGSHGPPKGEWDSRDILASLERKNTPRDTAGPALASEKNRQQVPAWPREQQPDSLGTRSRPEAPWAAPTYIHM